MRPAHALVIGALGLSALPVMAGAATAQSSKETLPISCDNGKSYVVDLNGNGEFTPAHIQGSTQMYVPHEFGEATATIRDDKGVVVGTASEPAHAKGSGKQKGDVTCTFSFSFTSDGSDPSGMPAGYTFSGSGTVIGKLTPAS